MNEDREDIGFEEKYKRWRKRNIEKQIHKHRNDSITEKYKEEGKIDEEFEFRISNMPLEDLIAIKLEKMYDKLDGKMLSLKYWKKAELIAREGMLKFAISVSNSRKEASHLLGIYRDRLWKEIKKFNLEEYFNH